MPLILDSWSAPLCWTHLESGLHGNVCPEELGSSTKKLSQACANNEDSALQQLPRGTRCLAAPRFLPLPALERCFPFSPLSPPLAAAALLSSDAAESFPDASLLRHLSCPWCWRSGSLSSLAGVCPAWSLAPVSEAPRRCPVQPLRKWAGGSNQLYYNI